MTILDRILQRWRIAKVRPFIGTGSRVLDIGCGDAALHRLVPNIGEYVGIDPAVRDEAREGFRLIRGAFPDVRPSIGEFDAIAMLASLEHVPSDGLPALVRSTNALLRMHGVLLVTVPDARVDAILRVLGFLRLIDEHEMKPDEHHGFDASRTTALFERHGFMVVHRERFQLGLNNCFALEKVASAGDVAE